MLDSVARGIPNEQYWAHEERLAELRRYRILDTPREEAFDNIAAMASSLCETPMAIVNFLDAKRQWFKAETGLGVRETPLELSVCVHAEPDTDVLLVPDIQLDPRFQDSPVFLTEPTLRFYAGTPLRSSSGHILGTLCVFDHVPRILNETQLAALRSMAKQLMILLEMRNKIRESEANEELAVNIMESSADLIQVLELDGSVVSINGNGERMLEIDQLTRYLGSNWIDCWKPGDRVEAEKALALANHGERARFEGTCSTSKGIGKNWDVIVTPMLNGERKPWRVLTVARDVTERLAQEARLREASKLETVGVMAGGIAHDFNNLLTGILGNASILRDLVKEEYRPFADDVVEASRRAASLTQQMLAYSGKGQTEIKELDVSAEAASILRVIRTNIDKKAQLKVDLAEKLPLVTAYPVHIQQLVMNLVLNAAESLEGKPGVVEVRTGEMEVNEAAELQGQEATLPPGRYVVFEVKDTGSGMNAETLRKIFDPFFTTKFLGRGLGLSAVSGIIRTHRGSLRVESVVGEGSRFRVLLPGLAKRAESGHDEEVGIPRVKRSRTILLVDDEKAVQRLGKAILERAGHRVVLADNGLQGTEVFRKRPDEIDAVILDVTMPVMGGEEALGIFREIRPDVPVLISSGFSQSEIINRFQSRGAVSFLQKPYTATQLVSALEDSLEKASL